MFTGIIEEKGKILRTQFHKTSGKLYVQAEKVLEETKIGDSIAVNGVCLTVTEIGNGSFAADVMPETVARSALGTLKAESSVNLERAMAANGRFGGHIVSGHIDGTGTVERIWQDGNAIRYQIKTESRLMKGVIEKGSIAIDGISLTVTKVKRDCFEVSVIPHTLKETNLGEKKAGALVNLENDMIGKYVERLISFEREEKEKNTRLTREFLLQAGF